MDRPRLPDRQPARRRRPRREAAARRRGRAARRRAAPFRVERTTLDGARARAGPRGARAAGEIVAAMGGDGLTGAVAGELRDGDGAARRCSPAGAATTSRASSASRPTPSQAATLLQTGAERRIDLAEAERHAPTSGILMRRASTPTSTGSRNETRLPLGTLVYTYGALRALAELEARAWDGHRRRRAARASPGYSRRRRELRRVRRRDVPRARRASSTTACSTSC